MLCVLTNNLYKWDKWSSVRAQLKKWRKLNHRGRAAFKRHAWRQRCHGEPDDWSKSHKSYSNLIEFGLDKALIEHFPPPHTSLKFGGRSAIPHPNDIWPAVRPVFLLHVCSDAFTSNELIYRQCTLHYVVLGFEMWPHIRGLSELFTHSRAENMKSTECLIYSALH